MTRVTACGTSAPSPPRSSSPSEQCTAMETSPSLARCAQRRMGGIDHDRHHAKARARPRSNPRRAHRSRALASRELSPADPKRLARLGSSRTARRPLESARSVSTRGGSSPVLALARARIAIAPSLEPRAPHGRSWHLPTHGHIRSRGPRVVARAFAAVAAALCGAHAGLRSPHEQRPSGRSRASRPHCLGTHGGTCSDLLARRTLRAWPTHAKRSPSPCCSPAAPRASRTTRAPRGARDPR